MSRTRPVRTSPVKLYLEWAGGSDHGKISYWDRAEKKNKYLKGLKFVVLDERASVSGFSEEKNSKIRGTEVKNTKTEKMRVWVGKASKPIEGFYQDLKTQVSGLRYAKVLYVGVFTNEGLQLCKLTLDGAANSAWMNFTKGEENYKEGHGPVNLMTHGVSVIGRVPKKKGSNNYYEPLFEAFELDEQQSKMADDLDKLLQEYFDGAVNGDQSVTTNSSQVAEEEEDDTSSGNYEDDYPDVQEETPPSAEDEDDLPF